MQDLTLTVELQSSESLPTSRRTSRVSMMSQGWAKLELFDRHGQLLSGRWRVPLRTLPIKPSLATRDLYRVPQVKIILTCLN